MKPFKRTLCFLLAFVLTASTLIPDQVYATNMDNSEEEFIDSDVMTAEIPDMAKEAEMDTADYILNNLNQSMMKKTADYSEKELEHVEEDPLVVNLGDGSLTTLDQLETTSQENVFNKKNYASLRYSAVELESSSSPETELETESESEQESEKETESEPETVVEKAAPGLIPTVHSMLINYSLVDPDQVKEGVTTVSIWDDTPEAFLASYSVATSLYSVEGLDDCFVAYINPGAMNGRADRILDVTFTDTDATNPTNHTDEVLVDREAGIAYIPKSIYYNEKGEEIPYDLLAQVMVGYDMSQEYNGINVTIENNSQSVQEVAEKQTVVGMSLNVKVTIPVATPETAKNLDLSKVMIFVNGNTSPVSFGDKEYFYNTENGELTIALAPITLYSLRIVIEKDTIQEMISKKFEKLRSLIVTETFAQTNTRADSVDDIKVLPYGTVHASPNVAVGQLFKKTVKMKYISNMAYASEAIKQAIYAVYEYCYYNYASDENGRKEYNYAKNGNVTINNYLTDEGFGHLQDSSENRTAFGLFNFFLKVPTGSSTATSNAGAKITFNIKDDIDYLVLHCVENLSKSEAIDSITPTGGWQDAEVWFRVLALTDGTIIFGICGPHCTTQAAYGVYAIQLDGEYSFNFNLKKVSEKPNFTTNNSNYSLEGAEYTLYEGFYGDAPEKKTLTAWNNKKAVGIYKTDSNGRFTISNMTFNSKSYVYFIKETKASKGYELDPYVYSLATWITRDNKTMYTAMKKSPNENDFYHLDHFGGEKLENKTIANGGTITFTSTEPLSSGLAQLVKTNSKNTSEIVPNAQYQVYTDSACTKKAKTVGGSNALFTTTSTGSNKLELAVGTYYVKETKEAPNYELNSKVYTLKVEAGKTTTLGKKGTSDLVDIPYGKATLKKISADKNLTDGNRCYSLKGAVYKVYSDASCTKEVGTLTTTEDGSTNTITIPAGDYWVKEITPSPGYGLCKGTDGATNGVHQIKVNPAETTTFTCKEPPLNDPFALKLQKRDADTGKPEPVGTASLEGALFQVDYWDNTDGKTSGDPLRTWVFKTDENGMLSVRFEKYLVAELSDELYKDENGNIVYPLGTYKIKEIQPPKYYQLDGNMKLVNSSNEYNVTEGITLVIAEGNDGAPHIYENGSIGQGAITADNLALDILEKVYKGKIKVIKYDTNGSTPLAGVTFRLVGDDGSEYTGTSNNSGEILFEKLIPQHYVLTEISTVKDHELLKDNIDITIPMEMTKDEANAEGADTSKAVWDEAAGAFCFYDIT